MAYPGQHFQHVEGIADRPGVTDYIARTISTVRRARLALFIALSSAPPLARRLTFSNFAYTPIRTVPAALA